MQRRSEKEQKQQHMNRTENILLLQKVLEITTRRRQAGLTAAPHAISYVREGEAFN